MPRAKFGALAGAEQCRRGPFIKYGPSMTEQLQSLAGWSMCELWRTLAHRSRQLSRIRLRLQERALLPGGWRVALTYGLTPML